MPQIEALISSIRAKADLWSSVIKMGRTHLQDAVPLTVGQEWSGWAQQLENALDALHSARAGLAELAAGGTAVGTGLNAPKGFGKAIAEHIAVLTGKPFVTAPNKFAALGGLDAMVRASAGLRGLAVALMKIANDMRWLGSGPRCGLAELNLPENEPGSSIMPGKVNPTQCESLIMIATQVMGNDTTVGFAGAQGNFELNVMRPVIAANVLHAIRILADGCKNFRTFSVEGTTLNEQKIRHYVEVSVMLVTALSPVIGYDKASAIAHRAMEKNETLREAVLASGVSEAVYDEQVDPRKMVGTGLAGA